MKLLILDFISRRRWRLLLVLALTLVNISLPGFAFTLLLMAQCIGNKPGWLRVTRSLPYLLGNWL